ncbi:MAG: archaemetzincin family Zn-dependent metalloprotease [Candidatus Omnitrophica bacterium]|nr:archaemetzincin family Zn-dependent metalloprotease [Candidatus Omnitrophota bacterium]MCM8791255.1 archaemetzincin family Zn-dependent metalloprotease [Candidatus Omnitrophota bacterium]
MARSVDERIYLVAVGNVDKAILKNLKSALPSRLPMTAKVVIEPAAALPAGAYSPSRKQYNAYLILDELSKEVRLFLDMERALFVIDEDIFVPDLNFVFGLADQKKGTAIISLARLKNEFYGMKTNSALFNDRVVKEAVHELGHTWGMDHCPNSRCVMYFSNNLQDTDRKRDNFCLDCRIKLGKRYSGGGLLGEKARK